MGASQKPPGRKSNAGGCGGGGLGLTIKLVRSSRLTSLRKTHSQGERFLIPSALPALMRGYEECRRAMIGWMTRPTVRPEESRHPGSSENPYPAFWVAAAGASTIFSRGHGALRPQIERNRNRR